MTATGRSVWRLLLRLVLVVAVAALLMAFGPLIWRLLSPFLIAIPIAALLQRPIRWSCEKLHLKHGLAVGVWVTLVCLALVALLYLLLSTLIGQVIQLSGSYTTLIADGISILRGAFGSLLDALDYLPASMEEWLRATINDVLARLGIWGTGALTAVFNFAVAAASSIPYGLIYLNFLVLGIFLITSGYERIKGRLVGLMGDAMRSRSRMLSGSAGHGLAAYWRVQLLYGVLVLVVAWPCLEIFNIPYAFLVAFIAAMLEFLPIFGNGTLFVPWAIICYLIGMPVPGTQVLVMHLTLYFFRRMTEPKLLSHQMGMSTLLSLVAMFVGMQLGGVMGLILAPVAVVVLQAAWAGGLFTSTLDDLRTVIAHVGALLREPAAEGFGDEEDVE